MTDLFLVYDTGRADTLNLRTKREESLDLFFSNVIGHDDRCRACHFCSFKRS